MDYVFAQKEQKSAPSVTRKKSTVVQRLSSTTLAGNIGYVPTCTLRNGRQANLQAHHIIPISVINRHISNLSQKDESFFDSWNNGMFLPDTEEIKEEYPYHRGDHSTYTAHVEGLWRNENSHKKLPAHADTEEKEERFMSIITYLRREINQLGKKGSPYARLPLNRIEDVDSSSEDDEYYE